MAAGQEPQAYVGRWAIRSATRPAVWPFLCAAEVEILPGADAARLFVRVRTAGGAVLRGYTFTWHPTEAGLTLSSLECNGRAYDLALDLRPSAAGRGELVGTWNQAGCEAERPFVESGWTAQRVACEVRASAA